jgi:hypothetical protein
MALLGAILFGAFLVVAIRGVQRGLQDAEELDQLDAQLDAELDDDEADQEPAARFCPRCGDDVDPDTGACERCLARLVRRQEGDEARRSEMPEPDAEEEREVARLQEFLEAPHSEESTFCPACLAEFAAGTSACSACSKPVLDVFDVMEHVERCVADITSEWFLPVLDDRETALFDRLLEEIRADPADPPLDYRVRKAYASWNGLDMTEVLSRHVPVLFIRRRELPRFRELVLEADLPKFGEIGREKLLDRLDALLRGRALR